jgi:hypothetical protein
MKRTALRMLVVGLLAGCGDGQPNKPPADSAPPAKDQKPTTDVEPVVDTGPLASIVSTWKGNNTTASSFSINTKSYEQTATFGGDGATGSLDYLAVLTYGDQFGESGCVRTNHFVGTYALKTNMPGQETLAATWTSGTSEMTGCTDEAKKYDEKSISVTENGSGWGDLNAKVIMLTQTTLRLYGVTSETFTRQ